LTKEHHAQLLMKMFNIKNHDREKSKIALSKELLLDCISILNFVAQFEVQISDHMSTQMKFDLLISSKTQEDLLIINVTFKLI